MTTKFTVEANHGWDVEVTAFDMGAEGMLYKQQNATIVKANTKQDFYVHSTRQYNIREIDPNKSA